MPNKGECYKLEIVDISSRGEGIGKLDGATIFIPSAIPGDKVLTEIVEKKKNYAKGSLKQILSPSSQRIDLPCVYAKLCGGCSLQSMNYKSQVIYKEKRVTDCLERIGKLDNPKVRKIITMEEPWRYRNKAQYSVEEGKVGFLKKYSHETIDCETCLLQPKPVEWISQAVREYAKEGKLSVYDRITGKGMLKKLVVRSAFVTGEIMVILRVTDTEIINSDQLVKKILNAVEKSSNEDNEKKYSLKGIVLNSSEDKNTSGLCSGNVVLYGTDKIIDRLGGLDFEISPNSFYQINPIQTEKLYSKVKEYAALTGKEIVYDLYCGVGTIGITLAKDAKKVIGIEVIKSATTDAKRNALINGIKNIEFICGKAEKVLPGIINEEMNTDVIILDPPRAGCDPKLLDAVGLVKPARIIYVSCNPATLARDIGILTQKGFDFIEAQPVDMFPHTMHVECVVLITRNI